MNAELVWCECQDLSSLQKQLKNKEQLRANFLLYIHMALIRNQEHNNNNNNNNKICFCSFKYIFFFISNAMENE